MATLSIRLNRNAPAPAISLVFDDESDDVWALVQHGIGALESNLELNGDEMPPAEREKLEMFEQDIKAAFAERTRPVITPKTIEVEDADGDHWFRTPGGFEMAPAMTRGASVLAGAADLERLFGPLTEITRAGSDGTVYLRHTAQDEGFEPDEADA